MHQNAFSSTICIAVVPHPSQHMVVSFFILTILMHVVNLILIFLMTHEDEHLFMCLHMEGYFRFIDWNTQYYKVVSVLQVNVQM